MGAVGTANVNTYGNESWRNDNPKYQEKTLGGVYFYSAPNSVWGSDINKQMYDKLPKHIQKSVVALMNSKTLDGNHASIWFIANDGETVFFDEYGLGDFYYNLKHMDKSLFGDVNDFVYSGGYNEGDVLEKKKK